MKQVKVLFMGTPDFAAHILKGLIKNGYFVVAVVSQPDRKINRKGIIELTDTKKVALDNDIPVYQPEKIRNDYQFLFNIEFDLIITCAYGQIIPTQVLEMAKIDAINVHASLLPKLRGGAPIHRAIIDGLDTTGVTIMRMIDKMDAGVMFSKEQTSILDTDNVITLHDRLKEIGLDLLLKTLPSIVDGTNKGVQQNESEVTFGYNIKKEEELINFNLPSRQIFNLIRGLCMWPTAYAILENKIIKIYQAKIKKYQGIEKPGMIIGLDSDGIIVKTADGAIIITSLQIEGKRMITGKDFINGNKNLIGKVFS